MADTRRYRGELTDVITLSDSTFYAYFQDFNKAVKENETAGFKSVVSFLNSSFVDTKFDSITGVVQWTLEVNTDSPTAPDDQWKTLDPDHINHAHSDAAYIHYNISGFYLRVKVVGSAGATGDIQFRLTGKD